MIQNHKTIAVIVTYNPSLPDLINLLRATSTQVNGVLIVDNSDFHNQLCAQSFSWFENVSLINLSNNMGIAYAQNIGLEYCIEKGAEFCLLLDQDSVPYPDMVLKLTKKFIDLDGKRNKIAAVAPVTEDSRTNIKSYFLVSRFGFPYRYKPFKYHNPASLIDAGFVISSGSLISLRAVGDIGGKRSNYFIDHVDTEWCYRARSKGYSLIGVHDAFLAHSLGDEVKWVWLFYVRYVPYHSPLRDYYMFRNTIFCVRDTERLFIWRTLLIFRLIQFVFYFLIFAPNRIHRAKMMLKGLFHGFMGVDGRLNSSTGSCDKIPTTSLDPR